jgi:hypothetical protein
VHTETVAVNHGAMIELDSLDEWEFGSVELPLPRVGGRGNKS